MKYGKALFGAALACGVVGAAIWLQHPDNAPVAPSTWIVQAATALNRDSIEGGAHRGAVAPADDEARARQLALEGQHLRVQRRFAEAEAMYRAAVLADPTDADAWADLADAAASAAGNDLAMGRDAIVHALAIDPRHRKALWLRASLELQEQRYTMAAATWRELRTLVAEGSTDARVITANIAEADALAALSSGGQGS